MADGTHFDTIVVGAGFGGLCMGAKLRGAGRKNFVILEKAPQIGGTWRDNTYPGAECDVPSALYSFSFAQNPTWKFKWAKQPQILDYLHTCCANLGLEPHLRLGCEARTATYDANDRCWRVATSGGEVLICRRLISAVGQLHHPKVPALTGQDQFMGDAFHSAAWRHDVPFAGRRVAVIGSAASAVQLVPQVAAAAQAVTVWQRSANWILPKGDRRYSRLEQSVARVWPGLAKVYRLGIWAFGEYLVYPMVAGSRVHRIYGARRCRRAIRQSISDPTVRRALLPDYPIGAKRILLSDQFYPTLARDNVELVTSGIERLDARGIVSRDGRRRDCDVIVYATGFRTNPFLQSMVVRGRDGILLNEHWRDGACAYLGVQTAGFPNLFLLYGPNTNTGHTSVVYMLEAQADYIVKLIDKSPAGAIEVRADAEARFNAQLQARLATMAWAHVENSWYRDGSKVTNNWPDSSLAYRRRLRSPNWAHFHIE